VKRFHRMRIQLLEWAADRGFYPAEHRLQVIRRHGGELASCMAWRALGRIRERRYYARVAELDAQRLGRGSQR
jgi:hypothetical protein